LIRRALFLSCLALCCLLLGCNGHGGAYVLRHADRDGALDRLKSPQGTDRAQALADLLDDVEISAVFSTDTVRTRSTAQPLATRLGLGITTYTTVAEVVGKARGEYAGKVVVIVGHSNTVPAIVTALDADLPAALPLDASGHIHHDDFDNLVLVLFHADGGAGAAHFTYGAATPPP
jgi:broad specificity phosphatase PhoE